MQGGASLLLLLGVALRVLLVVHVRWVNGLGCVSITVLQAVVGAGCSSPAHHAMVWCAVACRAVQDDIERLLEYVAIGPRFSNVVLQVSNLF
jgi:hypothetical protein